MKITVLSLLLVCFTATNLISQTRTYELRDYSDSSAVPYAHIVGAEYRTISNPEGLFTIPEIYKQDTFFISCIAYEGRQFVPVHQQRIIILQPGVKILAPVLITSLTPEEMLFRAVKNMQRLPYHRNTVVRGNYWNATLEKNYLRAYTYAQLSGNTIGGMAIDSVYRSAECAEFQLESLTSEEVIWKQTQVYPPLGCLNENNQSMWKYGIDHSLADSGEVFIAIAADFISPEKYVDHHFQVWVNVDRNLIERIEFSYQWNLDHPVDIPDRRNFESFMRSLKGIVLFEKAVPVLVDAVYELEICPSAGKAVCDTQKIYHEFLLENIDGIQTMYPDIFSKINDGTECGVD